MRTRAFAVPLTVQVGSSTCTFAPGRDVTVGRGDQSDVRLDSLDSTWVSRKHLVLRFDGTHWVAIDQSRNGTYVNGARVSTVIIRDGQVINVGDPHEGPRVVFRVGAPTPAPAVPRKPASPHISARPAPSSRPVAASRPSRARPAKPSAEPPTHSARRPPPATQAPTRPLPVSLPAQSQSSPTDAPTVPGLIAQPQVEKDQAPVKPAPSEPPRRRPARKPRQPKSAPAEPATGSIRGTKPSKQVAGESVRDRSVKPAPASPPRAQRAKKQRRPSTPPGQRKQSSKNPGTKSEQSTPASQHKGTEPVQPAQRGDEGEQLPAEALAPVPQALSPVPPAEQPLTDSATSEPASESGQASAEPVQPTSPGEEVSTEPGPPAPGPQPPTEPDDALSGQCATDSGQREPPTDERPAQDSLPPGVAQQRQRRPVIPVAAALRSLLGRRHKSAVIGRSPDSDITVDDVMASRVHARLTPTDAGLEIEDKASSNGTFVNGDRISRVLLREGDVVTVGNADYAVCGTELASRSDVAGQGLEVRDLTLKVDGGSVLTDVSFSAHPGTLTAITGPTGAGASALLQLLDGAARPNSGVVRCDGHDVHSEYASLRSRIATVPKDDVMHDRLTVEQILRYAAELRLPSDTSAAERSRLVTRVIDELELVSQRALRAGQLSDGERRRVTVAAELLAGPSLVVFDQRTFEPDQLLGRQMMVLARRLADAGRVVVVATNSLASLRHCDQVLLLNSEGKTAFVGPPAQIKVAVANARWSETFPGTDDPGATDEASPVQQRDPRPPAQPLKPAEAPGRRHSSLWRQTSMVARRQIRLSLADRRYFAFLASLPFIFGALSLAVPGHAGLAGADPHRSTDQSLEILVVLSVGAVFTGTALTIRELVTERRIFRRERSIGLSAIAYLAAKVAVFGVLAVLQTAVLTTIVVLGAGAPATGTVLPHEPVVEIFVAVLTMTVGAAIIGLALSAVAPHTSDVVPTFMLVVVISLVLCGGMFPLTDRFGANEISWLVPSRWGLAASASTIDVQALDPTANHDQLWSHSTRWWVFDMGMLIVSVAVWTGLLSLRPHRIGRKSWRRVRPLVMSQVRRSPGTSAGVRGKA